MPRPREPSTGTQPLSDSSDDETVIVEENESKFKTPPPTKKRAASDADVVVAPDYLTFKTVLEEEKLLNAAKKNPKFLGQVQEATEKLVEDVKCKRPDSPVPWEQQPKTPVPPVKLFEPSQKRVPESPPAAPKKKKKVTKEPELEVIEASDADDEDEEAHPKASASSAIEAKVDAEDEFLFAPENVYFALSRRLGPPNQRPQPLMDQQSKNFAFTFHCSSMKSIAGDDPATQRAVTINKATQLARDKNVRYMIWGEEVAATTQSRHLQGVVCFKKKLRLKSVIKWFDNKVHCEIVKYLDRAIEYCKKDKIITEFGEPPSVEEGLAGPGNREKARWERNLQLAKEQRFDEMDAQIYFQHNKATHAIARRYAPMPDEIQGCCGYYLYGVSGSGKSRYARNLAKEHGHVLYIKNPNKWWCGWNELCSAVLIDEMSRRNAACLTDYVKRWTDIYPFTAEIKGDSMTIRPKMVIFTSNDSIEDAFGPLMSEEDIKAIRRRFKVLYFGTVYDGVTPCVPVEEFGPVNHGNAPNGTVSHFIQLNEQ